MKDEYVLNNLNEEMEEAEEKVSNTPSDDDETAEFDVLNYENDVDPKYVPEGFESVEEFLDDLREEYDLDLEFDRLNRENAVDDKRFVAGDQWDPEVLNHRKGLPNLVINSLPQFTAQLVGDWRQQRPAIKVIAAEDDDMDVASIRTDLIRAIEQSSRASRAYDAGFESSVQCGDGAWRVCVDYARDDVFEQEIKISAIEDALSVVWDRFSCDPTGRDARRVYVDDMLPEREFNRKWPGNEPSGLSDRMQTNLRALGWIDEAGVRVTEYWRMIERRRLLTMFTDGSTHIIEADTNIEEMQLIHGPPIKTRMSMVSYAQMHLVTGHAILAGPYEYRLNRVPIIRCSGRIVNIRGQRVRFGIVRFMKDPARLRNFWRSIRAEQLGYAPKAKWIAPESAVEGREDEWRNSHNTRDPLLIYNDDAIAPPTLIPPAPMEAGLTYEADSNVQDMKDVTGLHDASLGVRSNEVSGKAISARQREGDVASFTYYDNANAAVQETGDVVNQLLPQVYDSTRIERLVGEDGKVKFQKLNDPYDPESPDLAAGKYDVQIVTGPSYTTKRQEAAEAIMNAVQVWPEIMQFAGDLVIKAQDWPGADKLSERIKKLVPQHLLEEDEGGQAIDPQQMMQMQEAMQQMMQQLEALAKENEDLKRDKTIDEYNAVTQRLRALSDDMVDGNDQALKAMKLIMDRNPITPDNGQGSAGNTASSTGGTTPSTPRGPSQ